MIKIAALTDIGNVRKKNQDGFFVDGLSKNAKPLASIYYESNDDDFFAFVADGVGSTNDAEFAVSELLLAASMKKDLITTNSLQVFINDVNKQIIEKAKRQGKQCACTVAGILVQEDGVTVFNVGDSKVFVSNNGFLEQLSEDDTAETLIKKSNYLIDSVHSDGKLPLLQVIGSDAGVLDCHVTSGHPKNDLIICTDGLTDMVSLDAMEEIVQENLPIQEKVEKLRVSAMSNGGDDNFTVIYVEFR